MYKERHKSCLFLMASFVSIKKSFSQGERKVPKIKSALLENSLNTINNRRNNKKLYIVESQHLLR